MNDGKFASVRFQTALEGARLPTGGLSLEEIAAEAAPLLPLLTELPEEGRVGGDYESFEFRECFTVLSLLGRRLALMDLTPATALQIVRLTLDSVGGFDDPSTRGFAQRATEATAEGFVLGREERVAQMAEVRAGKHLRPLRIDDGAFALVLSGVHEPSVLSECADALGRAMLAADVEFAIVDLTQLGEPDRESASAVFGADEVARMLGGACIFTGIDSQWRAAASDARIPLDAMNVSSDLGAAIALAREMDDRSKRSVTAKWRAWLKRLRS